MSSQMLPSRYLEVVGSLERLPPATFPGAILSTVIVGAVLEQMAGPNWAIIATAACTLLLAVCGVLFSMVRGEIAGIKKEATERADRIEQNTKNRAAEIENNLEERADKVEAELAKAIAMLQVEHKDSAAGITKQLERDRMDTERRHEQNLYFNYHMMLALQGIPEVAAKLNPDVLVIMRKKLSDGQ